MLDLLPISTQKESGFHQGEARGWRVALLRKSIFGIVVEKNAGDFIKLKRSVLVVILAQ